MRRIYLCKPGGVLMGAIGGVDENTANLKQSVSDLWELSFEVQRYVERDGELVESDYYLSLNEMMELCLVVDDDKVYFQIDAEPQITGDGITEKKVIIAHSIECELQTKFLRNFKVNTGLDDSLEKLVGYYDNDGNLVKLNINPYTDLPIDYIVVKNDYYGRLVSVRFYLRNKNLNVDSATGLIMNTAEYAYLRDVYEKFPRVSANVTYTEANGYKCDSYLRLVYANEAGYVPLSGVDYNIRIGNDEDSSTHSKDYLMRGIDYLLAYYSEYGSQLSLIDLAIEKGEAAGWGVGVVPSDVACKKYSFSVDNQDVLSFLKSNCVTAMKVLFSFDRKNKLIGVEDVENEDESHDTGVFMTYRDLVNTVNIKTSSQDGIRTRFYPTGANNLGIVYANFGERYIDDLSWFMDKVNEYGEYQYVSAELHDKYHAWVNYRLNTECEYMGETFDNRRVAFMELSKRYNQCTVDLNEITNRLPNDGCKVDYTTFPFEDLNIAYKAYANALSTLVTLYMGDVGAVSFDQGTLVALDGNGNQCVSIKDTFYWNDFACYKYTIIPNVMKSLAMYVQTRDASCVLDPSDPRQYDAETGDWIAAEGGNSYYNGDSKRVTENMSDAYVYDMSLYGTTELKSKQKAWRECAATMYKAGYVVNSSRTAVVDPIPVGDYKYNEATDAGWALLSEEQKKAFTGKDNFFTLLNRYLDYVSDWVRDNALTKGQTKGVIAMAQDAIDALQLSIDEILGRQDDIQVERRRIADDVAMGSWEAFDNGDLVLIHELIREGEYSNANILTTSLDDIVTTVDAQELLYQDAVVALSEKSRPQLSFEIGTDNLFALDDFKPLVDSVRLLNYICVSIGLYKDEFERLRIIGIERNPLVPTESLVLTFSNMTHSLKGISDFAYLFDTAMGGTSSGGSGGSGGGGGNFGDNDAEIQISNNMLNALLRSKTSTRGITQIVIDQLSTDPNTQKLIIQSGIFDDLQTGDMVVSGDCLVDYIKSSNYNDNTKVGSYLALKDGTFTYADGKLTWDGSKLKIDGSVEIGGREGNSIGKRYSGNYKPTTSNYPANEWGSTDVLKSLHEGEIFSDTSTGRTYVWSKASDGVLIHFDEQSYTEVSYDYVDVYYYDGAASSYYRLQRLTGTGIGDAALFVPASVFYVYFYADGSNTGWGFKIDGVSLCRKSIGNHTSASSLPMSVTDVCNLANLPETDHPYANNARKLYQVNTGYTTSEGESWGWTEMTDAELTSVNFKIDQVKGEISSEVSRAVGAEGALRTSVNQNADAIDTVAEEVHGTDGNGGLKRQISDVKQTADALTSTVSKMTINYSGTVNPTTSNTPASGWTTDALKAEHLNDTYYNTLTGRSFVWTRACDGVLVRFNLNSFTESGYDYLYVCYYDSSIGKYCRTAQYSGSSLSGLTLFVPASTFYIYWQTDTTVVKWGFKIDEVVQTTGIVSKFPQQLTSLPTSVTSVHTLSNLPETAHPYAVGATNVLYQINTGYTLTTTEHYTWVDAQEAELGQFSQIKQTATSVSSKVGEMDNGNYISSLINQTATTVAIQAQKIDLTVGGASNGKGALYVNNASGAQIGRWDKDGIWAANGTFDGMVGTTNGKNYIDSKGNFSLGNGALVYNPTLYGDNNIHLGNNLSLVYNGASLVYEDVSSSVGCGYQNTSSRNKYYQNDITTTYYSGLSYWSYSFSKTSLKVYRSAQIVTVYFKFWATGQCNKSSILLPGLPLSLINEIPIEIKKLAKSDGTLTNSNKMAYLKNDDNRFAYLILQNNLEAFTSEDYGQWVIYFTYVPKI